MGLADAFGFFLTITLGTAPASWGTNYLNFSEGFIGVFFSRRTVGTLSYKSAPQPDNSFRTAVPFWGQITSSLTGVSPHMGLGL